MWNWFLLVRVVDFSLHTTENRRLLRDRLDNTKSRCRRALPVFRRGDWSLITRICDGSQVSNMPADLIRRLAETSMPRLSPDTFVQHPTRLPIDHWNSPCTEKHLPVP